MSKDCKKEVFYCLFCGYWILRTFCDIHILPVISETDNLHVMGLNRTRFLDFTEHAVRLSGNLISSV